MPAIEQKKGLSKKDIYLIIGTLIVFLFGYICPKFGGMGDMGMKMLGVVIGVIFMTCVGCPITQSSLIALLAFPIHGYMDVSTLLTKWTGTTTTFQLVFAGALLLGLRQTGAMNVIAKKMLGMKITKGRPGVLMFIIMTTGYVVSTCMGGAPFFLLFYGLIDSMCEVAGYDVDSKFKKYALLGVYVGAYGGFLFYFRGAMAVTVSFFDAALAPFGLTFNGPLYMLYEICTFIPFNVIFVLALKFIFRVDMSKLAHVDVTKVEQFAKVPDHFDKKMKIMFWSVLICIAYAILTAFAKKTWPGYAVWGSLTVTMIWVIPLVLFSLINVDGEPIINLNKILSESSLWMMISLVGIMVLLGTVCTDQAENMGIRGAISSLFGPIFGNMSIPLLLFIVTAFATLVTQVVNGQVLTLGITPIIAPIVCEHIKLGEVGNPTIVLATLSAAAQVAYLFPSGSVNAAYILSRKEINSKFLFTSGLAVLCIYIIWQYVIGLIFNVLFPVTIAV